MTLTNLDPLLRTFTDALLPEAAVAVRRRQGIIDAVNVGPPRTVDVAVGGFVVPGVSCLDSYDPAVNDVVFLDLNGSDPLVIGTASAATKGRYFSLVGLSTDQPVTGGVVHTVPFDTVVTEDEPFFNNTSNTWTLPESGLWELHLTLTYISDANTTTDSTAIWDINGSLYEGTRGARPSGSAVGVYSHVIAPIAAGQVVTPQGFIVATNPRLVGNANTERYCRATIRRIGPA